MLLEFGTGLRTVDSCKYLSGVRGHFGWRQSGIAGGEEEQVVQQALGCGMVAQVVHEAQRAEDEQDWSTSDMIFDVPALIEFLSASTTLVPGTVILTGTPHGVGMARQPPLWLREGDSVSVEIESIGSLTNPVQNEAA